MRKDIHHYLSILEAYDPLTKEEHARMEARVRREVIARFGSFVVPQRAPVHTVEAAPRGTLVLLRPAFAFAAVFAIVIGTFAVVGMPWKRAAPAVSVPPSLPNTPVIAVASSRPIIQGSGIGVTVFAPSATVVPSTTSAAATPRRFGVTPKRPGTLTPSEHVFGQPWGTSVFAEKELRRLEAERVSVFSE